MKIKDLIEALQQYDPELDVWLEHDEAGLYEMNKWGHLQAYEYENGRLLTYGEVRGAYAQPFWVAKYKEGKLKLVHGLLLE